MFCFNLMFMNLFKQNKKKLGLYLKSVYHSSYQYTYIYNKLNKLFKI